MADNTANTPQNVVIDNISYKLSDLPEAAVTQLGNVRVCDAKLAQLQQDVGMVRTARAAYVEALKKQLDGVQGTPVPPQGDAPAVTVEDMEKDEAATAD